MAEHNALQFKHVDSTAPAADYLAQRITEQLARGQHVLWLVSGGSSIDVAVAARRQLQDAAGLVVMQVDERFGPVGHPDSNWQKLLDAGFDTNGINVRPALTGKDLNQTTQDYNKAIGSALQAADFSIGLFGLGADGHTAGLLPGCPALDSPHLVASYQGADFVRITMTPIAIAKLDEAIVCAMGNAKRAALEGLRTDAPVDTQPAQTLTQLRHVTIFNNVIGG